MKTIQQRISELEKSKPEEVVIRACDENGNEFECTVSEFLPHRKEWGWDGKVLRGYNIDDIAALLNTIKENACEDNANSAANSADDN